MSRNLLALLAAILLFAEVWCIGIDFDARSIEKAKAYRTEAVEALNTAEPVIYPDDLAGTVGLAAMYSLAHDARGKTLPSVTADPHQHRNVWRTKAGSIFEIAIWTSTECQDYITFTDATDRHNRTSQDHAVSDRGKWSKEMATGATADVIMRYLPGTGAVAQIYADGDVMTARLDDLYTWRREKLLAGSDRVTLGGKTYLVWTTLTEHIHGYGIGNALFREDLLLQGVSIEPPTYVVTTRVNNKRTGDRLPIGTSGYSWAWNHDEGIWYVEGRSEPAKTYETRETAADLKKAPEVKPKIAAETVSPPESASKGFYTLENAIDFNVLDRVIIDPQTERITLVGHHDARYAGQPIPYLDHLAELLKNPTPEFSFNWTPESRPRVKALFENFDSDEYVKGLIGQWSDIMDANGHPTGQGRWVLPLIGIKPTSSGERLGYLGVEIEEITLHLKKDYEGLKIISVESGEAAERAGLLAGDVITNYANAALFMHDNKLRGEGGQAMLQIWRDGAWLPNMITVTLGGMPGDPWAELDKFDFVQKMLWAAGNEKGAMLINSFAQVQRHILSGSKAGYNTSFSILVAVAGFNDPYWQDVAEYEAGRMSQNEVLGHAYRAIFGAMEDAFAFEDRPLTNVFDSAMQSGFDSGDAFDRTIAVFNERIEPYLEQIMNTLLARNEEIQIPPEVMLKSVGSQVEVAPEYIGVDPHSALARLLYSADYIGKSLINMPLLAQKIPKYQSDFAFERNNPDKAGPWHASADYHLWCSIDDFDLAQSKDGNTLFTRGAKMRFNIREIAPDGGDAPAVPGGYEELLTSLYDDFAIEFSVLHELREAAKVSTVAEWLRSKKPDMRLPDAGRISVPVQDKAPGFVYLTLSPKEHSGRLAAALSAMGGVTFKRKVSSLDLIRAPEGVIGVADDSSVPAVDLSEDPVTISKILSMPVGAPGPQPVGWVTTGTEDGQKSTAVSFIPPQEKDLTVSVPLQQDAVGNAVMLWKADDLEAAKKLSTEYVQKDRQRYVDQLQRLMNETDRMNVPSPVAKDIIQEGVILGLTSSESEANKLIGTESPFSKKPYKEGEVFATAASTDASEYVRGLLDNASLGEFTLNTPHGKELVEKLSGKHFNRLIAHSNGATVAEALIRKGVISVDELNVVGGDRSIINQPGLQELIYSGKVKRVVVWNNPGDIIPKGSSCVLPTPVNLTGSIPLVAIAGNIARTLTGQGQGGDIKVEYPSLAGKNSVTGELYGGQEFHLNDPVQAHGIKVYLENIKLYFGGRREK